MFQHTAVTSSQDLPSYPCNTLLQYQLMRVNVSWDIKYQDYLAWTPKQRTPK